MKFALTKRELIEKLAPFSDDQKVYVGGQYWETVAGMKMSHSIYAAPVIDVEMAPVNVNNEILLITDED